MQLNISLQAAQSITFKHFLFKNSICCLSVFERFGNMWCGMFNDAVLPSYIKPLSFRRNVWWNNHVTWIWQSAKGRGLICLNLLSRNSPQMSIVRVKQAYPHQGNLSFSYESAQVLPERKSRKYCCDGHVDEHCKSVYLGDDWMTRQAETKSTCHFVA